MPRITFRSIYFPSGHDRSHQEKANTGLCSCLKWLTGSYSAIADSRQLKIIVTQVAVILGVFGVKYPQVRGGHVQIIGCRFYDEILPPIRMYNRPGIFTCTAGLWSKRNQSQGPIPYNRYSVRCPIATRLQQRWERPLLEYLNRRRI